MKKIRKLIKSLVQEEIGRNYHTIDTTPNTFQNFQDYEIMLDPNVNDAYTLTILYKDKKLGHSSVFMDHEEGLHHARMIIDKHRVQVMQSDGPTKKNV